MTTITFDTLAFTEELTAAGIPESQAKAHAKAQARVLSSALESQELATKGDIATLQREIVSEMASREERLRREIAESKTESLKWIVGMLAAQTGLIVAAFFAATRAIH